MTDSPHVVCVACGAINRLPGDRDAAQAKCGGCGKPLFSGAPADVSGEMFERQVSRSTLPVVVDVWAPWCGPCLAMAPEYQKASQMTEPRARFLKLNSDNEQQVAGRLGIRGIPTMLLYRNGKEIARTSGSRSARDIVGWIETAMR